MPNFNIIAGTVLAEKTSQVLHIEGSFKRGHGDVLSNTTKTQEFWVQKNDGNELRVNLGTKIISLRPGQEVVMAYYENYQRPSYIYIKNTGEEYQIWNPLEKNSTFGGGFLLISLIISAVIAWVFAFIALYVLTFLFGPTSGANTLVLPLIQFFGIPIFIIIMILKSKSNNINKKENEKFWHDARAACRVI